MDALKKTRNSKTRTITRRLNEPNTVRVSETTRIEVEEKIANIKYTFAQLAESQDDLLEEMGKNHVDLAACVDWYRKYEPERRSSYSKKIFGQAGIRE